MTHTKMIVGVIFAAAVLFRLVDSFRPLDQASWRESDIGAIARNFTREGMNPLSPRIDWRGTGPGYAEMELPLYPWLIAVVYKVAGDNDMFGRLVSLIFSIGTLFFFFRLAREYLDSIFAIIAFTFFAFNPLIFDSATSVQPEGLTIFAYVAAVYFFVRWLNDGTAAQYVAAAAFTALTILAKAPAAHIGILFAVLLFEKYGLAALTQLRVWAFGVITLLPAAVWYVYANGLYKTYGNSLGVSNEYHWIGADFFTNPDYILGILRNEMVYVWTIFGVVVAAFGLIYGHRERTARFCLAWLGAVSAFLLVAARTTAADWASYYHIFAVGPAAILFGFGCMKLRDLARSSANTFSMRGPGGNLVRLALIGAMIIVGIAAFAVEGRAVRAGIITRRTADPAFAEAGAIKPRLVRSGLLLVSGGDCHDADGYALAYNASYMFYWLDRKGFNICTQQQTIEKVRSFADEGAEYFVAQRNYLGKKDGFESELRQTFSVVDETTTFVVFDLRR